MFLSALVWAVSFALRTIMAWTEKHSAGVWNYLGNKSYPISWHETFKTSAAEAEREPGHQDGSYS